MTRRHNCFFQSLQKCNAIDADSYLPSVTLRTFTFSPAFPSLLHWCYNKNRLKTCTSKAAEGLSCLLPCLDKKYTLVFCGPEISYRDRISPPPNKPCLAWDYTEWHQTGSRTPLGSGEDQGPVRLRFMSLNSSNICLEKPWHSWDVVLRLIACRIIDLTPLFSPVYSISKSMLF